MKIDDARNVEFISQSHKMQLSFYIAIVRKSKCDIWGSAFSQTIINIKEVVFELVSLYCGKSKKIFSARLKFFLEFLNYKKNLFFRNRFYRIGKVPSTCYLAHWRKSKQKRTDILQEMLPMGMKMSNYSYSAAALADVMLYISLWEKHFFEKE